MDHESIRETIISLLSRISFGVQAASRLIQAVIEGGRSKAVAVRGISRPALSTSSLIVFVAVTSIVAVSTIIVIEDLVTFVLEGESGVWTGFGADNDDEPRRILWGPLKVEQNQNIVVTNLAKVAFAIVLGPILHELNDEILEYSKAWSMLGMGVYLLLLLLFFGRNNPVAWVIFSEFILLVCSGSILGGLVIWSLFEEELGSE